MTITALVVAALGVFTHAVTTALDGATKTGTVTQEGRVVMSRIANQVAKSRQVLRMSDTLRSMAGMDQVLLVWERDGGPDDPMPGQINFVELVIYAPSKNSSTGSGAVQPQASPTTAFTTSSSFISRQLLVVGSQVSPTSAATTSSGSSGVQLLELRPNVDPSLVVPLDQPDLMYTWIERFRSSQYVVQPPGVLVNDLGGIHFDLEEYPKPQGIGGVVQQYVRVMLHVNPLNQQPAVFFGSATQRYAGK